MRIAALGGEIILWWAVAFVVWLLTLSTAPLQELLLAAVCALPCAVAANVARRATGDSWRLRPGWLVRPLLVLPVALLSDTVQVFAAVLRRGQPGGSFEKIGPAADGDDMAVSGSRRAVATWLMSVTPGNYVLDADPETAELIVHTLAGRGPSMASQVVRERR